MTNSHYISRFLTRPWETAKRDLIYYSFADDKFITCPSKRLFAQHGLFPDDVEAFFNKTFENPIDKEREAIATGKADTTNFKSYKALTLLIFLQAGRVGTFNGGNDEVSKIVKFSEDEVNSMVVEINRRFKLVTLNIGPQYPLKPPTSVFDSKSVGSRRKPLGFGPPVFRQD